MSGRNPLTKSEPDKESNPRKLSEPGAAGGKPAAPGESKGKCKRQEYAVHSWLGKKDSNLGGGLKQ
jgi:hypothetical protein